ncbi:Fe-Mn family superoxide dismutase [Salinicola sp. RZ23]|uniref:Fe-Mn family superoxide dismutase n=1 Tax=Salinicola sp. RZ23 TaxID=1949087 RepID=UPI0018E53EB1|nr:Fe-Mn family superoxide dismutase [Salinicola sp. RZ23]
MPTTATPGVRFELPALPFERHSLEPALSRAQIDLLYSHYHRHQLTTLNAALAADDPRSLATLAAEGPAHLRPAAAQAWGMTLFWHGLCARPAPPETALGQRVARDVGDWGAFEANWKQRVISAAPGGFSWLGLTPEDTLTLVETPVGELPPGIRPLVAIPLCEEAYRIDFGHDRGAYFSALWSRLNWETVMLLLGLPPEHPQAMPPHAE